MGKIMYVVEKITELLVKVAALITAAVELVRIISSVLSRNKDASVE